MGRASLLGPSTEQWKTRGPFLETPDNFPGPVSIFSSSFIYHIMVIIGANLAIMLHEIIKIKI